MLKNWIIAIILVLTFGNNSQAQESESIKLINSLSKSSSIKIQPEVIKQQTIMFVARKATKTIFGYIPTDSNDVGHTFVAIINYDQGKISNFKTFGKYPTGLITNNVNDYADMTLIAKGKDYDRLHFEEMPITDYQLSNILVINSRENEYDLTTSNCAHYMQRVMNSMLWFHNGIAGGTENPTKYHESFGNRRYKF